MSGVPFRIADEEILAVLRECWNADERDALEGGVATETIADRVGMSPSTARKRLAKLYQRGAVERVWGIDPDDVTSAPRLSYAPPDDVDSGADELPGDTLRGATTDD